MASNNRLTLKCRKKKSIQLNQKLTLRKFDEAGRLSALRDYQILDTLTEDDYDSISFLASVICDVPVALVAFLDEDRNWFKAHHGTPLSESPRAISFCQHAIAQSEDIMVIEDLKADKRFDNNPLVHENPGIVFYAGAPLVTKEGYSLGTVCALGTEKKRLNEAQQKSMIILSKRVMEMLELRKQNTELQELRSRLETKNSDLEQFAMIVAHDIKSPLTSIMLANQMLELDSTIIAKEENKKYLNVSGKAAHKIKSLVDGILSFAKAEHDLMERNKLNTREMIEGIFETLKFPKEVEMKYEGADDCFDFNTIQAEQIFINLINNAVRYNNNKVAKVTVSCVDDDDMIRFVVTDNGIGISENQQQRIFELFTSSTGMDSFGVKGTGIGLATVKKIVENNQGTINVESSEGEGSKFIVRLPKKQAQ